MDPGRSLTAGSRSPVSGSRTDPGRSTTRGALTPPSDTPAFTQLDWPRRSLSWRGPSPSSSDSSVEANSPDTPIAHPEAPTDEASAEVPTSLHALGTEPSQAAGACGGVCLLGHWCAPLDCPHPCTAQM
jgi:hypothetical protein